jgi:hypothetical protein
MVGFLECWVLSCLPGDQASKKYQKQDLQQQDQYQRVAVLCMLCAE